MHLRQLWCESTIGYTGKLPTLLGNGQDMTLNFGGTKGKPPILFAPFPISAISPEIAPQPTLTRNSTGNLNLRKISWFVLKG